MFDKVRGNPNTKKCTPKSMGNPNTGSDTKERPCWASKVKHCQGKYNFIRKNPNG